jgi:hypothetical protein
MINEWNGGTVSLFPISQTHFRQDLRTWGLGSYTRPLNYLEGQDLQTIYGLNILVYPKLNNRQCRGLIKDFKGLGGLEKLLCLGIL